MRHQKRGTLPNLVQKYLSDLKIICTNVCWGTFYQNCLNSSDPLKNMVARRRSLFSLYVYYKVFKNLLVQKYRPNLKIIWHKCSLGDLLPKLFKIIRSVEKRGRQRGGLFSLYVHCKQFKKVCARFENNLAHIFFG